VGAGVVSTVSLAVGRLVPGGVPLNGGIEGESVTLLAVWLLLEFELAVINKGVGVAPGASPPVVTLSVLDFAVVIPVIETEGQKLISSMSSFLWTETR